ncbi:hypothetical protein L873DRAFT_1681026, partial [Choiromyces venosus 120613-1]
LSNSEPCIYYVVYMDNVFATIPLFETLQRKGIDVCGTTHVNGLKYSLSLKSND